MLLPAALMGQVTLPWTEDFDSYTTGGSSLPTGWTRVNSATSGSATYPNIFSVSGHGNVLNFNGNYADGTGTMRIATPAIPASLNALELSFMVYKSTLKVYGATDPTDLTTYHFIGSYAPGYSWGTYEVRTDTITGMPAAQGYLVFTANYGSGYGFDTPYLDNLTVMALNSCERPNSVTAENIGPNGATLSWDAVTNVTDYRVSYSTTDNMATAASQDVTGTSLTLTGLIPDTQYYVWVQSLCDGTSTSDARTATFTTQRSCYPPVNLYQASAGFDAASFAWEFDPRGNSATGMWTVLRDLTDPTVEDVEEESTGETSHFVSNLDPSHSYELDFYTLCGDDTALASTLPIVFKVCGESQLAHLAHDYDMHPVPVGYNYGYAQMLYPADVFLDMDTIRGIALHRYTLGSSAIPVTRTLSIWMHCTSDTSHNSAVSVTGMTQVANDVSYTFPVQEWDTIYFTTPFVYTAGSNVLLTIDDNSGSHVSTGNAQWMWHEHAWKTIYKNHDTSNPNPVSVTGTSTTQRCPDMHFVGACNVDMGCVAPIVAVTEVDETSAVIAWVDVAGSLYTIEYRTLGAASWTVAGTANYSPFTIQNLQPSTHYEVRVGLQCEEMRYSDAVSFTTGCDLMELPFHFSQSDMYAAADAGFTDCWTWSSFGRGILRNQTPYRGYVRNLSNDGGWFMLPAISEPIQTARLRTWVASSTAASVKVGVASLPNCSDVVWVDTIEILGSNPNSSHDEYVCYLDNYTGTGNRVVVSPIVTNGYHYVYFFDFHLEQIEDCRPARNLVLDSTDAQSLSVSWTPVGAADSWVVYVDGVAVATVNNTPYYTITGRAPYTDYEVSVRGLCGTGDTSDAISAVFRTACEGDQCSFTIHGMATTSDGWKGGYLVVKGDNNVNVGTMKMLTGSTMDKTFSVCADMEITFDWMSGNADAECSFTIVNSYGQTLYTVATADGLGQNFFSTDSICDSVTVAPEPPTPANYSVTVNYDYMMGVVTGAGTYPAGTQVTLVATPYDGYHFVGWSNGVSDSVYQFTLTSNVTLSASFAQNVGIDPVAGSVLTLSPNPASNRVTVSGFEGLVTVSLVDLNGREVYRQEGVAAGEQIDLTTMANGVYFVRIVNATCNAVGKLIVR